MTTDTQLVPTDAEIDEFLDSPGNINWVIADARGRWRLFARAVLAKWGTPAPVGVEPFAWADDGSTRSGATATSHRVVTNETKKSMPAAAAVSFTVPLYTAEVLAVPLTDEQIESLLWKYGYDPDDEHMAAMLKEVHGIKGGQHGD